MENSRKELKVCSTQDNSELAEPTDPSAAGYNTAPPEPSMPAAVALGALLSRLSPARNLRNIALRHYFSFRTWNKTFMAPDFYSYNFSRQQEFQMILPIPLGNLKCGICGVNVCVALPIADRMKTAIGNAMPQIAATQHHVFAELAAAV
ncbi:MAG: hypothetical protein WCX65_18920, partial [bacterium]